MHAAGQTSARAWVSNEVAANGGWTKPLTVYQFGEWTFETLPAEIRTCWLSFLATTEGPCPVLQSPGWLADLAEHDCADVRLLVVRDASGTIVGIQPTRHGPVRLTFKSQRRQLFALTTPGCTLIGSEPLVVSTEIKPVVMSAILDYLRDVPVIELTELKDTGDTAESVAQFAVADRVLYRIDDRGRWSFTPVPSSVAEYDASLGKKKRYNLKRQDRLLAERLGGELNLVVARTVSDLGVLNDAARRLTGWSEARMNRIEASAATFARTGLLHSFVLTCAGRPIGLIRASAWGDQLHVHSIHHDATLDDCSPGTAVWQAALRYLITNQIIRRITFSYGDPAQLQRAVSVVERRAQVLVFRPSARAWMMVALHRAFSAVKRHMKHARSPAPNLTLTSAAASFRE